MQQLFIVYSVELTCRMLFLNLEYFTFLYPVFFTCLINSFFVPNTETFPLNVVGPSTTQVVTEPSNNTPPIVTPTPVVKETVNIPTSYNTNSSLKTVQSKPSPTTTIQVFQQQMTTTTQTVQTQPGSSHNIFTSIWNFLKRLF